VRSTTGAMRALPIRSAAVMPSITGILMSMTTTSGLSSVASATARSPSPASPTTLKPASVRVSTTSRRISASSSATTTRRPVLVTLGRSCAGAVLAAGVGATGAVTAGSGASGAAVAVSAVEGASSESATAASAGAVTGSDGSLSWTGAGAAAFFVVLEGAFAGAGSVDPASAARAVEADFAVVALVVAALGAPAFGAAVFADAAFAVVLLVPVERARVGRFASAAASDCSSATTLAPVATGASGADGGSVGVLSGLGASLVLTTGSLPVWAQALPRGPR